MISKEYIQGIAKKGFRHDGRKFDEYRQPVEIEYGVSSKSAEGSARVKVGDTEVVAGVKLDIGTPYSDKPDEGSIMVNVELLPLSSTRYEAGPPDINAIELSRVIDRGIRECHAVDFKKLCVEKGEKVWMVFIDIYPINAAGNLADVCSLAALAALKDAKFPTLKDGVVDYKTRTKDSLPVQKDPVECTVWKVADKYLIDPTVDEEFAADARLTLAFTDKGKIAAMQKGGESPLSSEDIESMATLASEKAKELRGHLK
ncbi:RNA-binding protein [archaeon]|nr:RNA-binding protein [archaeon]|tara:strand:- start:14 stop:787 length:774 start_codon:yes stop_codon:yes gene_type:complete